MNHPTAATDVVVTAMGVCTPLGRTPEELWANISRGAHAIDEVRRMDLQELGSRKASGFGADKVRELCERTGQQDTALAFAVHAGRDALARSQLDPTAVGELALLVGTSAGAADLHLAFEDVRVEAPHEAARFFAEGGFHSIAAHLAEKLGLSGPRAAVSTACASGGHVMGLAHALLASGVVDRILVLTTDSVHPWLFAGFGSVGALAPDVCAPFGEPPGLSLGEGAAAVVLETREAAVARGATAVGSMLGWGGSSDAFHETSPEPRGTGIARSIEAAVASSGHPATAFSYYNAHGTGTRANDSAESLAVQRALPESVQVSSTKSQLGHTQGSAGLLEAVVTLKALEHQAFPPSLRSRPPRRMAHPNTVPSGPAVPGRMDLALSHSSAFGGTNVTVALGPPTTHGEAPSRSPVFVRGVGAVCDANALSALVGGESDEDIEAQLRQHLRGVSTRGMDPISRRLTAALRLALDDAQLNTRKPRVAERIGLLTGMADGPQSQSRSFVDSCTDRGFANASAPAFARMVMNAPTGAASLALQIRGPSIAMWGGPGAGHQAVFVAAQWLATRDDIQALAAGGADEVGSLSEDRTRCGQTPCSPTDGAAVVVLTRDPTDVQLAGAAWGAPEEWQSIARSAAGEHAPSDVLFALDHRWADCRDALERMWPDARAVDIEATLGHAPATSGALGVVVAVHAIRDGRTKAALVITVARDTGAVATLWTRSHDA